MVLYDMCQAIFFKKKLLRNSLEVQWSGLHILTAEGLGLIPAWGTKILQTLWHGHRK